jgi:hypothetical protein
MPVKDARGRYLARAKRRVYRGGLDLTSFASVLKDYYKSDEQLEREVTARAKLHHLHPSTLKTALGWSVRPTAAKAKQLRIAKRVASRWVGTRAPLMPMGKSPLLALLPKRSPEWG